MATEITGLHGAMDVVMNIAGIASWGTITAMPHRTWQRVVDVNLMGPIAVLEHLVPPMIEARRGGHVVNVSSAAGIIGMPWHAPYSATKFGLRGVSEVLRFDLARHRIGVTLVCPGGVDTPIQSSVDIAGVDRAKVLDSRFGKRFRSRAKTAEHVADCILNGVTKNRYLVYTSADIRALHLVQRTLPHTYAALMRGANKV